MRPTIFEMVSDYCRETGDGHLEERDGEPGIVFHDENEWIALRDLGYNHDLGFFRKSQFPDQPDITQEAT